MDMEKIHYICNYDDYNNNRNLNTQPSAVTKINYIKSALKEIGFKVMVFSTAECVNDACCLNRAIQIDVDSNETILYQWTFGRTNIGLKVFSKIGMFVQLIIYLLFHVKKEEKILVYHSLPLLPVISFIRRIKKRKIYFEVEEIFHAVYGSSNTKVEEEKNRLKGADGYILVNDIMKEKCAFDSPAAVCYGVYKAEHEKGERDKNDGKVHIVYAGVISEKGSDAYLAVDVAQYLPANYIIHLLGYGPAPATEELNRHIARCNRINKSKVVYEGCLLGEEYSAFLSKCQIGLCTRTLENNVSDYTFPSKVMVYIANRLIPVCTPISCIMRSKIKDYVVFSADISPKSIAESILGVDISLRNTYNDLLSDLDKNFKRSLKDLFDHARPSSN